jgi:hypothetical protein
VFVQKKIYPGKGISTTQDIVCQICCRRGNHRGCFTIIGAMLARLPISRSNPCVGTWCAATTNRGLTSLVSLPNSRCPSVLLRALSADKESLNRITYPVLVVPIPATCTSWLDGAHDNAVPMWVFAAGVGKYRPNTFTLSSVLGESSPGPGGWVLIRTQFFSFSARRLFS